MDTMMQVSELVGMLHRKGWGIYSPAHALTEYPCSEGDGVLGSKDGEKPWSSVKKGSNFIPLQKLVNCWDEIVHQS